MVFYKVTITHSAEKELVALKKYVVPRIWKDIRALSHEPRPRGSLKLKGMEMSYRIRIGDYRIIYRIDDKQKIVTIVGVRHRKEAY